MKMNILFIIINLLLYMVSIALFIAIPDEEVLNTSTAGAAICLSIILVLFNKKHVEVIYKTNRFKEFSNAFMSIILIIGILGLLNYLSYKNPQYIDLTNFKKNSLTQQSQKVVKNLPSKAKVTIFARKENIEKIGTLFELYRLEGKEIETESIDIALRPDLVKKHSIDRVPSILIEVDGRKEMVYRVRELEVTNAFIKLSRKNKPVVCNLVDHGELDMLSQDAKGAFLLQNYLANAGYRVLQISMLKAQAIHKDCNIITILGPKVDYPKSAIDLLKSYLKSGKNILAMIDPIYEKEKLGKLKSFFKENGVNFENNTVIDIVSSVNGSKGTVPLVNKFEEKHPLGSSLVGPIFFPLASSVSKTTHTKNKWDYTAIIKSGKGSWGERNTSEIVDGEFSYNVDIDDKGPLTLMASVINHDNGSRLVAVGNSSLITNSYSKYTANFKLILNSLSWLDGKDTLMTFDRADIKDAAVFISRPQVGIIFYFSVIFTPLLLLVLSAFFYYRRLKL